MDLLGESIAFALLGALLVPVVRLLGFNDNPIKVANPRESALWAVSAIGAGWILVISFLLLFRGDPLPDSPDSSRVTPVGPEDVIGQLFVALVSVAPILIVMRKRKESLASSGVSRDNFGRSLAVGALLLSGLVAWWGLVLRRSDAPGPFGVTGYWALLQFAVVGVAEEFAYRGYLQTRLVGWLGGLRGWVWASVLMATAHVGHRLVAQRMTGGEALVSCASLIPVSLFLGYVMLRTRSVVAPAILHTAINLLDL